MSSINQKLKQKRLESNTSIEKIASELNIRKQYIIAIEEEDYSHTPGKVYTEGYIKLYATYLGVDYNPDDLNEVKIHTNLSNTRKQSIAKPFIESSTPSQVYLFGSIIALLMASYFWSAYSKINNQSNNITPSISFYNLQDRQFLKSRYDIIVNSTESTTDRKSLNYFLATYPFVTPQEVAKNTKFEKKKHELASSDSRNRSELIEEETPYIEEEVESELGSEQASH
ncbi:MAG: hypothetical protein K0Q51_87 [Rickettsiaceae bacterium]|nr:hypothetical protein [Rickettsiaceae bacterium]